MEKENKQPNNGNNIKTVRTYLSDMAETVRANEISVIKVALAEQNKNERENIYRQIEGTNTKKFWWFVGGIIFIVGAIVGSYFIFNQKEKNEIPVQIEKDTTIISYDEMSSIEGTDDLTEKINKVKKEIGDTNKTGSIKFISLTRDVNGVNEKIILKDFFTLLGFRAPSSFIRSLSDKYMIGTYTTDRPHLFIIFQIKDYEYAYAGMLDWEKTLASDVVSLFELDTKETKLQLEEKKWKDLIINNKDSRILKNENNKIILYYLFNNKNNLIITDSEDTLKEIITKLIIKNIKPL